MKRLDGMDAMFLHTETATQFMHTLKVAIYDPPEEGHSYSFEDQFEHIASTVHQVPPFRWKAVNVPFNVHNPVWINDPHFDLALHVHRAALPAPGGPDELSQFIENIASTPLNRDRPLWDVWMVENYQGNRIAAVSRVHHALADGVASAELLEDFMTPEAGAEIDTDSPWQPEQPPSRWRMFWWALKDMIVDLAKFPGQIKASREAKRKQAERNLPPDEKPPEPYQGVYTPLNQAISSRRKYTFFTVELADVKFVAKTFGLSVNDVVLNMAAQATRNFLEEQGQLPAQPLTATVPVSTRTEEQRHTYGNKVSSLCINLHTDIEDPVERMHAIHKSSHGAKLDFEDTKGGKVADFIGLLPPVAVRAIGAYSRRLSEQKKPPSFNIIVSNVPGPRQELFDDYMPMREFYSIGPILEGIGLNITAWSFRDNLSFSILTCHRAVPDPRTIRQSLIETLEDLVARARAYDASKSA